MLIHHLSPPLQPPSLLHTLLQFGHTRVDLNWPWKRSTIMESFLILNTFHDSAAISLHTNVHVNERSRRISKQGHVHNKAKQPRTPKAVIISKKKEPPRLGIEPTTLYTLDRELYQLSYRGSLDSWAQILHLIVHLLNMYIHRCHMYLWSCTLYIHVHTCTCTCTP